MRKRLVASMLVMLFVAGMVVGGGGFAQKASAADPVTLTFWTFQQFHVKLFEEGAAAWNKEHPDKPVKIQAEVYPYEDMHTKLLVALQSGVGAPDICDIEISKFPNYLKGSNIQLVPLNDIVEPVKDKFVQARLLIYAKDGKYYGAPTHVGATVMYYNTDILKAAGVDVDKINTWDDYIAAGKQVVEKTGKPMTTVEVTDQWTHWPLISEKGSDFLDKDKKISLDDDINISVLQFESDLIYKHKIAIIAPGGFHHTEEYWGFMNKGGAASVLMPMWYMGRFVDYMPDLKGKIIIRPLPRWEPNGFRSAGMGGTGTAITAQSKNIPLAKEFLAYAKLSADANIRIWNILGFDPPRWDVWPKLKDQPANKFTDYFGTNIFDVLMAVKDEIRPVNIGELTPAVTDAYRSTVAFRVLEKKEDPAKVLKEVAAELRAR